MSLMPSTTAIVLVSPPCFHHRQVDRRLTVDQDDVALDLMRVFGVADVGDGDGRAADGLQRNLVDLGDGAKLAVGERL